MWLLTPGRGAGGALGSHGARRAIRVPPRRHLGVRRSAARRVRAARTLPSPAAAHPTHTHPPLPRPHTPSSPRNKNLVRGTPPALARGGALAGGGGREGGGQDKYDHPPWCDAVPSTWHSPGARRVPPLCQTAPFLACHPPRTQLAGRFSRDRGRREGPRRPGVAARVERTTKRKKKIGQGDHGRNDVDTPAGSAIWVVVATERRRTGQRVARPGRGHPTSPASPSSCAAVLAGSPAWRISSPYVSRLSAENHRSGLGGGGRGGRGGRAWRSESPHHPSRRCVWVSDRLRWQVRGGGVAHASPGARGCLRSVSGASGRGEKGDADGSRCGGRPWHAAWARLCRQGGLGGVWLTDATPPAATRGARPGAVLVGFSVVAHPGAVCLPRLPSR